MNLYVYISRLLQPLNYGKQSYATERKLMSWGVGGNKVDQCNTQILLIQLKTL